jgi:tetratricopeptide (TPR) repeat protein
MPVRKDQIIVKDNLMNINEKIRLAREHHQAGNLKRAVDIYLEILENQPNNAAVLHLIGVLSYQMQNYDFAMSCFRQAIQFNPNYAEAYNNLGSTLKVIGQFDEAIACYRKAIELNPNFAEAYYNLGNTFIISGQLDNAITYYQKALQLNPDHAISYNNLGNAYREKGLLDEAISSYQKALQLNSNLVDAYNNIGVAFQEKGQLDEAITCYQKAIKRNPNYADAYNNLGYILQEKGQLNTAINYYKKALQLNPYLAGAHGHLSLALLLTGDYDQGWKEYEWRWRTKEAYPRGFSQPLWDGTDITGLTILLHAEQGMGDTIQFIRYAPSVAQRCGKVIVECHRELTSLLRNVEGVHQIISRGEQLPAFDTHCPLLSLPLFFDTTLENIPARIPYVTVNPVLVQEWRDRIQYDDSRLRTGLVWAGAPRHKENRNRSCSLELFSALGQLKNITFYSLQKGAAAQQAKNPPQEMNFIDLTQEINDFSDTAALIENLDLVISVDTSVAHLAGALGKPVWTLLPFSPDWRWLLNREDSPWYPTMRLFRQPSIGDWEPVITKVADELQKLWALRSCPLPH